MSTKKKKLRSMRRYSEGFKRARVSDFENGLLSVAQMSRLYEISQGVLYRWLRKYSTLPTQTAIIMEVPDSQTEKVKQLEQRLAQAQQLLGRQQIELDYYKTLLEIGKEQGYDWEKKALSMRPLIDSSDKTEA